MQGPQDRGIGGGIRHGGAQSLVGGPGGLALGLEGGLVALMDGLHLGLLVPGEVQPPKAGTLVGAGAGTKSGALSGEGNADGQQGRGEGGKAKGVGAHE